MKIQSGDLYVSAVEGHLVSRFGSAMSGLKAPQIGAYPDFETDSEGNPRFVGMKWNVDEVVRIPRDSYVRFIKEYDRAISDGALKLRTKEEFDAYIAREEAAAKTAADSSVESKE